VIGAELPADVTYWDVPAEYGVGDYRYTAVNDETVLVDPRTRRIVQIVDLDNQRVPGAQDADDEIAVERQQRFGQFVDDERRPSFQWDERVAVGAELPDRVPYWEVPPEYGVRNYRYTVVNGTKVLMDPHTRRIVQVIGGGDRQFRGEVDGNHDALMRRDGEPKREGDDRKNVGVLPKDQDMRGEPRKDRKESFDQDQSGKSQRLQRHMGSDQRDIQEGRAASEKRRHGDADKDQRQQ